jgi:FMN phosphatase YigB (HAD superfamily)
MGRKVEEVWFLDDNPGADATAKAAGMRVCGVYDDSSAEYTQQMREICDAFIEDFSQITLLDSL